MKVNNKIIQSIIFTIALCCILPGCGKKQNIQPPNSVSTESQEHVSAPGHVHTYSLAYSTAATCKEEGKVVKTCSCGDINTEVIPKSDHSWKTSITKKATCTQNGEQTRTCSVCKITETEEIPKLEHKYEIVRTVNATCSEIGCVTKVCKFCKNSIDEEIPKKDHIYISNTTDATCVEDGSKDEKCVVCGDTKTIEIIKAKGHEYKVTKEQAPTCMTTGVQESTCTRCGDKQIVMLEKIEHVYTNETLPAGCEVDGYKKTYCKFCEEVKEEIVLPATGHDYRSIAITPSTCTQHGTMEKKCSRCNNIVKEELDLIPHTFTTSTINPNCVASGTITESCIMCGTINYSEPIPALGHDYVVINTVPATCQETGTIQKSCQRCQDAITESIPKKEHDYVLKIDTDEIRQWECSVCGSTKTDKKQTQN